MAEVAGSTIVSTHEETWFITSDPSGNGKNFSPDGTRFEVDLEKPLLIPKGAINASVSVITAAIWNTVPNISAALGNNILHMGLIGLGAFGAPITLPDGSYSTATLNAAIKRELIATLGVGSDAFVTLGEDVATNRVEMIVDGSSAPGVYVDFSFDDTFREIVGFDAALYPPLGNYGPAEVILAPFVAAFNNIESFKLHSNVGQSIRTNNRFDDTLAQIFITQKPGSQVIYAPRIPSRASMQEFTGAPRTHFLFYLTDHRDQPAPTGEVWQFQLQIRYSIAEHIEAINDGPGTNRQSHFPRRIITGHRLPERPGRLQGQKRNVQALFATRANRSLV